jgi:membrane fusion protein, heavy metal efflux system
MKIISLRINSINSYLLSIILLVAAASCTKKQDRQQDTAVINENSVTLTSAQFKNAAIAIGKIEQKTISQVLRVNGKIDVPPQNMVSVSVPLGGYLKYTKLLPGMHLTKGESIAIMEDQQYIQLQQEFLTAKTKLNFTANEYQRQKELSQSKATSEKIFQQTEADYLTGKINVKALSEKLKLIGINPDRLDENTISKSINIYAPINGYVSKVNVNIGKYTQPSEVLFELINPTDIHLALTIFEKDLNKISIGQKLVAYTNGQPGKMHACEVIFIGKDLSLEGSTVVHCHFENYDKSLVPGMYMNAVIELENNAAYVLPEEAIVRFQNQQYVFLAIGPTEFELMEVQIGNTENGFTEVISGSRFSDKSVVLKGSYNLLMKMKNKVDE